MLEKLAAMFGASATHYKYLLQTEKTVEKRSLEGAPYASNILNYVLSFFISAASAFIPILIRISVYNYALIGITVSMLMIGMWTFPYFDILIYPINYAVVAHTPISSRTYFLVKLTQVLSYAVKLLFCLNILPAIGGFWVQGGESVYLRVLFPFIYLLFAFMSGFFTISLMTCLAGAATKLYAFKHLRKFAKLSQRLFPVLFPSAWIIIYLLPDDITPDKLTAALNLFYVLPNGWFAGSVSVVLGQIETRFLISTALAFISTVILIVLPLRSIAKTYSSYLTYLLESDTKQKSKLKVKISRFAKFIKNRTILAGLCMSSVYLYRDKRTLQGILGIIGGSVGFFIGFVYLGKMPMPEVIKSLIPSLNLPFYLMFCYFGLSFISFFLSIVRYSEHWKASWIFHVTPRSARFDLWRSVQICCFLYVVTPYTLLLFCVAIFFWGVAAILYVLPNLVFILYNVLFHPKPASGVPFSEEINPKKRDMGCLYFIYVHLAMIIYIGTLFVASLIGVTVYIVVYCVLIVGGFIGFVYLFTRDNRAANR